MRSDPSDVIFTTYVEQKRAAHTKAGRVVIPKEKEIVARWSERIAPSGLHQQGEAGARAYLNQYGRGISEEKCIALALLAEREGCIPFALGFWSKALELRIAAQADE